MRFKKGDRLIYQGTIVVEFVKYSASGAIVKIGPDTQPVPLNMLEKAPA